MSHPSVMMRVAGPMNQSQGRTLVPDATMHPFFAVDVETTGVGAAFGERVIEIGVVCIQNGALVSEWGSLSGLRAESLVPRPECMGLPKR
jgi:DNA polymerase III epsilon subunit-like protein